MNMQSKISPIPDFTAVKIKQNAAWASGDYAKIGVTLQKTGEDLAETMDLRACSHVLDVAAGNGNATLAMARRQCRVTSTDYVETLLVGSRNRARAEGLDVKYQIADAEELPFENQEFDAVVSTFGVMFAPNQEQAASELLRVCRSGGKIGMANWTTESFIGQLFKTLGRHVAPPNGVASPARWGDRNWIEATFAGHTVTYKTKSFVFRYRSPAAFLETFRTYYGPVHKAFSTLDQGEQAALAHDILQTVAEFNTSADGSMRVPSAYAETVIAKT